MKKLLSLILSLLILTLSLLSCAVPAAQEEATPTPTPTAQPTVVPSPPPTPDEPDYDSIVLPEPKSEKWESYERIIFSTRSILIVSGWDDPLKNGIYNENAGYPVGEEHWLGVYPFNDETNGFYATKTTIRPDDMFFIELLTVRQSMRKKIDKEYEKRLVEADKLIRSESTEYLNGLKAYIDENRQLLISGEIREQYEYYNSITNDRSIYKEYMIDQIERLEAEYDKKWLAEHGGMEAKDYFNALVDALEYKKKVTYSLVKDDIDYFNKTYGFDLYYYYDLRYERCELLWPDIAAFGIDSVNLNATSSDPRLRGFIRADCLETLEDIELPNGGTCYIAYNGKDFLTDYCNMTFDDLPDYSGEFETKYNEQYIQMYDEG